MLNTIWDVVDGTRGEKSNEENALRDMEGMISCVAGGFAAANAGYRLGKLGYAVVTPGVKSAASARKFWDAVNPSRAFTGIAATRKINADSGAALRAVLADSPDMFKHPGYLARMVKVVQEAGTPIPNRALAVMAASDTRLGEWILKGIPVMDDLGIDFASKTNEPIISASPETASSDQHLDNRKKSNFEDDEGSSNRGGRSAKDIYNEKVNETIASGLPEVPLNDPVQESTAVLRGLRLAGTRSKHRQAQLVVNRKIADEITKMGPTQETTTQASVHPQHRHRHHKRVHHFRKSFNPALSQ